MLEFALALTFVSLLVLLVALIGRYLEMRRDLQEVDDLDRKTAVHSGDTVVLAKKLIDS